MDESVPVEELVGALGALVDEGYVGSIGMTQASADELRRAAAVRPIAMAEYDYSLGNRAIEQNGVLDAARENDMKVLAFGVLMHGMLSGDAGGTVAAGRGRELPPYMNDVIAGLDAVAADKGATAEAIAQAYVCAKDPDMSILIGTTRKEHLQESIDALSIELSVEDLARIDAACASAADAEPVMRNIAFRNGRMSFV